MLLTGVTQMKEEEISVHRSSLISVADAEKSSCRSYKAVTLSGSTGYIASIVSEVSGCGSADTPWIIQVM